MNDNNEKKPEQELPENNHSAAASEAVAVKNTKRKKSWKREVWEWVYTLAIAIAVAFSIKIFVFDIVRVDGSSMYPTLENNDRLIVTKLGYTPHQGDIVILDSTYKKREAYFEKVAKEQGKDSLNFVDKFFAERNGMPSELQTKYYVKRVIALPGQTVDLVDGYVYVDGAKLDEPYYDGKTTSIDASVQYPITVEDNCVFVMGDNRNHSKDSRSSDLGQVPYGALLGKSQLRVWPLNKMGVTK
ncbi:MAG: signal peptidase I [Clostridia bacterium]|nr:signal peptidase I [Clostridia bacterium]